MTTTLRSLASLLHIKDRRGEELRRRIDTQASELDRRTVARDEAVQVELTCQAERDACHQTIADMGNGGGPFQPADAVTLLHVLDGRQARCQAARKATEAAELALEQQAEAMNALRQAQRKIEAQRQQIADRHRDLAQVLDLAAQDVQDNDIEEAMAGRAAAAACG